MRDRLIFAAAVVGVWGAVGPARLAATALRDADLLSSFVLLAFGVVLLGILWVAGRDEASPGPLILVVTALAAAALFSRWEVPEERFHLVLYPPLGWLACRTTRGTGTRRAWIAIALVVAAGLGDEALQGLHPDRQFDWMDVLANALGGAIVPLLSLGAPRAWLAPALLGSAAVTFELLQASIGVAPPAPVVPPVPVHEPGHAEPPVASVVDAEGPYAGHNVVLVTVDALRADHTPPTGRPPVPTPSLDSLAASSFAARRALASGTWTSPSMVSLLTGLHPAVHGVHGRGLDIAPGPVFPLEALGAAGYTVVGHAGDETENYRNLGFEAEVHREDPAGTLESALAGEAPVFAWIHLRDVHAPYDASPERLAELGLPDAIPEAPILQRARSHFTVPRASFPGHHSWLRPVIRALYAAEVADADVALSRILDSVRASGEENRTLVVLTADHGEELLEADGIGHASTTLDSVPRDVLQEIPLLIHFPDGRAAGQTHDVVVRQQDLMPTLLPLLGIASPRLTEDPALGGIDLGPLLLGAGGNNDAPTWFVSSPCGWQCPPERRAERVAALLSDGRWTWCRYSAEETEPRCDGELSDLLRRARVLADTLRTPVPG